MRRTKEEAEKTKKKIMYTALPVFNKKGYEHTTLEDIAKAAGVTRGAIYHHFENKAQLLKNIAIHHEDNINEIIKERIKQTDETPTKIFHHLLETLIEKLEGDSFFRDFEVLKLRTKLTGELTPLKEYFDCEFREGITHLNEYLTKCQEVGLLRKDINVEACAISIIAAIIGLMELYTRFGEYVDVKSNLTDVCTYLLGFFEKERSI